MVATNPVAFRAKYNVATNVLIFGPFAGSLQDNGENLELRAPDNPNSNAVPYVVMDAVRYNDKSPWPPAADGSGMSLQRLPASGFGNEPTNWIAAAPTPGEPPAAATRTVMACPIGGSNNSAPRRLSPTPPPTRTATGSTTGRSIWRERIPTMQPAP